MVKRKYQADESLDDVMDKLEDLRKFLEEKEKTNDELPALAVLELARRFGLTLTDLRRVKETTPSFSSAKWDILAPLLGLKPVPAFDQLEGFSVPLAHLPPSFHRKVMNAANHCIDVYQEAPMHARETARIRLLDAWYVPICGLFDGRVIDKPESPMPETPETSGGEVEHELHVFDNIIFLLLEMKLELKDRKDCFAQILVELLFAMKSNKNRKFQPQPPVYAILTDLHEFHAFSYDGIKFRYAEEIIIKISPRAKFLDGMVTVTEFLFSLILDGFIQTLEAVVRWSTLRGEQGDVSEHTSGKALTVYTEQPKGPRPSLDKRTKSLLKAREAREKLVSCDRSTFETWEATGVEGLTSLRESLSYISKVGSLSDWTMSELQQNITDVLSSRLSPTP